MFIFIMGMTYFLILAIFGMVVPLQGVTNISKLLPYKVLYILFFLNLIICEIKWIPVVIRRCRKPKQPETLEELERFGDKIKVRDQGSGVRGLEKYLRRRGYKIQLSAVSGQGSEDNPPQSPLKIRGEESHVSPILYAYKGRFSPIGNFLFHISFLFLLAGVGLGIAYRFDGKFILAEGQGISGGLEEYVSVDYSDLVSPPAISLEVDKISPRFWDKALLFTDLKAEVSYGDGKKGVIRLSQPLRLDGARVVIDGLGITPAYLLEDAEGRELDRGYVNLNTFLPRSEDWFQLPDLPYRIYLSYYPDFDIKDGKPFTRSMNQINPAFKVKVLNERGKRIFEGFVKPGEAAPFDGFRLSILEVKYSGVFRVVYDRGFGFIWTGFIVMITGLVWRLMVYKREIVVRQEDSGNRYIAGYSDYHRKLFASELEYMAGMK